MDDFGGKFRFSLQRGQRHRSGQRRHHQHVFARRLLRFLFQHVLQKLGPVARLLGKERRHKFPEGLRFVSVLRQPKKLFDHLGGGLDALVSIRDQHVHDDFFDRFGDVWIERAGQWNDSIANAAHDLLLVRAEEQPMAREQLPENDSHRVHIAARIKGLARDLFRAHVGQFALDRPTRRSRLAFGDFGDPKIADFYVS